MSTPTNPRWLDADELETWLALVGVFVRLPAELDRQLRRDSGMGHFEYQVMARLSDAPDHTLRMGTLASLAEGSLPRLSQTARRLEERGWISRMPDPADGRSTLATLTEAGMAKLEEAAPGHVEAVRTLVFDPLTKTQIQQLRTIGQRIVRAIDPDDPCVRRAEAS